MKPSIPAAHNALGFYQVSILVHLADNPVPQVNGNDSKFLQCKQFIFIRYPIPVKIHPDFHAVKFAVRAVKDSVAV